MPDLLSPRFPAWPSPVAGLTAGAATTLALGGAVGWPALLLPLSVAGFVALWMRFTLRASRLRGWALAYATGVVGGHLALWLPFLVVSWLDGQGAAHAGYAFAGASVTALAVAWYVLTEHLVTTLVGAGLAVLGVLAVVRSWQRVA